MLQNTLVWVFSLKVFKLILVILTTLMIQNNHFKRQKKAISMTNKVYT